MPGGQPDLREDFAPRERGEFLPVQGPRLARQFRSRPDNQNGKRAAVRKEHPSALMDGEGNERILVAGNRAHQSTRGVVVKCQATCLHGRALPVRRFRAWA